MFTSLQLISNMHISFLCRTRTFYCLTAFGRVVLGATICTGISRIYDVRIFLLLVEKLQKLFFLVGGMWPWASWSQLTNKAHDSRKRTSQLLNYSCLCTVYMTSSTSGWPTSNCPSTNLRQRAECECACRGYWKKWCCWSTLLFSEQGCQDTCFDSHHPSSLLEARSNSPECNVNPWMDVNRTHVASITLFFLSLDV